jgi:hypothetical protein
MTLTLCFFLFISVIFLFFGANVVLSPKRNPLYAKMVDPGKGVGKSTLESLSSIMNIIACLLTLILILSIPLFQVIGGATLVAGMLYWMGKHYGKTPEVPATEEERELSPFEKFDRDRALEDQPLDGERTLPGGFRGGKF